MQWAQEASDDDRYGPQTAQIEALLERVRNLTEEEAKALRDSWVAARAAAWDAWDAWDAAWAAARAVAWDADRDAAWAAAWDAWDAWDAAWAAARDAGRLGRLGRSGSCSGRCACACCS